MKRKMSETIGELSHLIERYEAREWDNDTLSRFLADAQKILDQCQCKESRALLSK